MIFVLPKVDALANENRLLALAAQKALRVVIVFLTISGTIAGGEERVGERRLARLAHETIGMKRAFHGVDELAIDDLIARCTNRRHGALEAVAAIGVVVIAFVHLAAVAKVIAAVVARQMIRVPCHAKRMKHRVVNLFSASTTSRHSC